jgi:enoyl reductase-like protein
MVFLEKIRTFFDSLETKTFYYYIIGYLSVCFLLFGLIIFYYYKNTSYLQRQIKRLNTTREDTIRTILEAVESIDQQKAAVEAILSQNPDFKIAGYFKDLLNKLNLKNKEVQEAESTTTTEREDNYRETELNAKFENMNMKELTELLQAIEQNARISTKRLEITKAKKNPKTIEVQITITTLLPKITEVS